MSTLNSPSTHQMPLRIVFFLECVCVLFVCCCIEMQRCSQFIAPYSVLTACFRQFVSMETEQIAFCDNNTKMVLHSKDMVMKPSIDHFSDQFGLCKIGHFQSNKSIDEILSENTVLYWMMWNICRKCRHHFRRISQTKTRAKCVELKHTHLLLFLTPSNWLI